MSLEQNKAVARRVFDEVWNGRNLDVLDEVLTDDYRNNTPEFGVTPDRQGVKQWTQGVHQAFPDGRFTVEEMVAEGDRVVTRWTAEGTHTQPFLEIPATNKRVKVAGVTMDRIEDGKIAEGWTYWDRLDLLQQLGVVQAPG